MDLHEQTEKRINAESEQLGGTWEDHALRKWSYWQEAHRQRCEEIEKLQEKMRELELAHGEAIIQRDEYRKENSELRKGIEEITNKMEKHTKYPYSGDAGEFVRELRSLVKKEVK